MELVVEALPYAKHLRAAEFAHNDLVGASARLWRTLFGHTALQLLDLRGAVGAVEIRRIAEVHFRPFGPF